MNFAVPLYAIIDATDEDDAARQKAIVENLLKNDMIRMTLISSGVRVRELKVTDPYLMAQQPGMPEPAYPQQPQYGSPQNGRR